MTRLSRIALHTLLAALACALPARAQSIFIKAAKVHTLAGEPLSPGQILIKDGKIAAIGSDLTAPADARVIDLKDGVVMPGLVNAASRAGVTAGSSEATEELTPRFKISGALDWRSRDFKEALAEGVTTQLIAPDTGNVISGQGCVAKSG